MHPLRVLAIGDPPDELHAICATLLPADAPAQIASVSKPGALKSSFDEDHSPDLIVLCESWPGQWTDAEVDCLRRAAPLARFVRLSGTWCEGQGRSGRPPSGCPGTSWLTWRPQVAREMSAADLGKPSAWMQPSTASGDDRAIATIGPSNPAKNLPGTAIVVAGGAATANSLADVCRTAGMVAGIVPPQGRIQYSQARVIVWDAEPHQLHDRTCIAAMKAAAPTASLIAVSGFPRAEDVAAARSAGVTAVLVKPFLVADLLWHLTAAVESDRLPTHGG